ncbi:MAG: hypothetical protein LH609_15040 [Rudanella sp.]|nr:hypothetical protein [Rudanella sp.]
MKPLLIYDASCPACEAYTKGFVPLGWLPAEARQSNQTCHDQRIIARLAPNRMRHELPLVDLEGPEVRYGVDAMLTVISFRFPGFAKFIQRTFLYGWAKKLYAFVSYNRRVVFPTEPERWQLLDFAPRFHTGYRLVLITFLFGLVGLIHWLAVGKLGLTTLLPLVGVLLAGGIAIYQAATTDRLPHWLDYVGHVGVSLFAGAVFNVIGISTGLPFLSLVGDAVMVWQLIIRLRVMLLPYWLVMPFMLLILLN